MEIILASVISFSLGALLMSLLWRREIRESDKAYQALVIENQALLKKLAKASKNDKRNSKTGRYEK